MSTGVEPERTLDDEARLREEIRDALRLVIDPELGIDIITLDLLRGMEFGPSGLTLLFVLTTPFCPYAPELIAEIRARVGEVTLLPLEVRILPEAWRPPDEVRTLLGLPGSW